MNNDERNALAEDLAMRIKTAAAAGQTPDDLHGLVFVNVKTLIAWLTDPKTMNQPFPQRL